MGLPDQSDTSVCLKSMPEYSDHDAIGEDGEAVVAAVAANLVRLVPAGRLPNHGVGFGG
jgi:hypothetical protein